MALTARVQKLRQQMVDNPAICVERLKYMTESYRETESLPNVLRRALALEHILTHMTVRIDEGELFAGNFTSKARGGAVIPELKGQWLLDELDTLSTRPFDKYQPLSEEEIDTLKEYLPYWQGRAAWDRWQNLVPEKYKRLDHIVTGTGGYSENGHHWAHTAVNYEHFLKLGSEGIIAEAQAHIDALQFVDPEDLNRRNFWQATQITHRALIEYGARLADLADEQAAAEQDPRRKAELERIAVTCRKVPAKPAETFFEALQAIWIVYVALLIEGWGAGTTFGRIDQYMYPYYKRDIDAGVTTKDEVQELLTLMFVKMSGAVNLQSYVIADGKGGHPIMQGCCVGGITPDGRDAVNELSYMILDAEGDVGLGSEDIMVRLNKLNPESYYRKALETAKKLGGKLKFVSDETSIQSMLSLGVPLEKARDYISAGCHNPTVPYFSRNTGGGILNMGLCTEMALNNGRSRLLNDQYGPETGDPRQFTSFEQVWDACMTQMKAGLRLMMINKTADLETMSQYPCVLLSSMYDPCMEKGLDDYNGGTAPFITFGCGLIGSPNMADSLTAIKKVVFEDKKATMAQLCDALDANFEGYEWLLALLNKAPKYGNDIDEADLMLKKVISEACDFVSNYRTWHGARFLIACFAMTTNVTFGRVVGALPDGRVSGLPLSEGGISPYQGRNVNGITATFNSVCKIDQVKLAAGSILNARVSPELVKDEAGMRRLTALVRTFAERGGNLVQFNFADNKVLKAAQKDPDSYRDLLVRVATYSAFFVELGEETQNDIINRNELG